DLHRRLVLASSVSELRELQGEVADRFGQLPPMVENLFAIQEARLLAAELGAEVVAFRQGRLTVSPVQLGSPDVRRLKELQPRALYTVAKREVSCKVDPPKDSEKVGMRQAVEILAAILEARAALAA